MWRKQRDEDDVDRLNRVWTVLIFVVTGVAAIVYVAVFPDAAISCVPAFDDITQNAVTVDYANKYCLNKGNYLPDTNLYYEQFVFSYHTFVPLFLFYHILGFIGPHVLAQLLKQLFGSNSEFLFRYAEASKSEKHEFLGQISSPPPPTARNAVIYVLKKLLFLINSVVQLVAIEAVFTPDKSLGEIHDTSLWDGAETPFPRHASCEFKFKDTPTQTYQCAFHINGLYLKFYLFMFYWLLILTVANAVSLFLWILLLSVPRLTLERIRTYTMSFTDSVSTGKMQTFVKDRLGKDYLLNLLLARSTEREATAADLTMRLWQSYHSTDPNELQTSM